MLFASETNLTILSDMRLMHGFTVKCLSSIIRVFHFTRYDYRFHSYSSGYHCHHALTTFFFIIFYYIKWIYNYANCMTPESKYFLIIFYLIINGRMDELNIYILQVKRHIYSLCFSFFSLIIYILKVLF